ncbi:hypothetical protein [Xenorhabdus ehlersii]|uniref:Periplasmic protein n=1 Tax=Xenorhabdus ehlersii TaxID=290111 RepID=A0A2D0IRM8_9GAMM|nr:hypothetical protein [Xenorhabdus ehlersii]PHM24502.1 hypothetical protein Xehl_02186 [Xenorhabdus ehlersii]RKE90597.1 hypothetical protein BDE27_2475 [Xenorhabdus ehlersii]
MKYRLLFVVTALLFLSSYAVAQDGYWYEGCPKYSTKGLSELIQRTKTTPIESIGELQQYSKGEVEVNIEKIKCDLRNLAEHRQKLKDKLKEIEELEKSQIHS